VKVEPPLSASGLNPGAMGKAALPTLSSGPVVPVQPVLSETRLYPWEVRLAWQSGLTSAGGGEESAFPPMMLFFAVRAVDATPPPSPMPLASESAVLAVTVALERVVVPP
jgi:hypothetical protein